MRDVTLAILAGGAGSRMGEPKANLSVRGRPILQYLFERFNWPGPTMLVTTLPRQTRRYEYAQYSNDRSAYAISRRACGP